MAKWADYCISAVRYSSDHAHIETLEVREDSGESLGPPVPWLRAKVVSTIDGGTTFVTILKNSGKWTKGEDVRVIEVDGKTYLRTDPNQIAADNLGNLPEF